MMGCIPMRSLSPGEIERFRGKINETFRGPRSAYGWMMLRDDMGPLVPEIKPAYKRLACRRPLPGEE